LYKSEFDGYFCHRDGRGIERQPYGIAVRFLSLSAKIFEPQRKTSYTTNTVFLHNFLIYQYGTKIFFTNSRYNDIGFDVEQLQIARFKSTKE